LAREEDGVTRLCASRSVISGVFLPEAIHEFFVIILTKWHWDIILPCNKAIVGEDIILPHKALSITTTHCGYAELLLQYIGDNE
jgi:hypothetical protein